MGIFSVLLISIFLFGGPSPVSGLDEMPRNAEDWKIRLPWPACESLNIIKLEVPDVKAAAGVARNTAKKMGATHFTEAVMIGGGVKITFIVSERYAKKAEKNFMGMGRLAGYEADARRIGRKQADELRERMAIIKAELELNGDVFESMPVIRGLMRKLLDEYVLFLERMEASKGLVGIEVTFLPAEARRRGRG